MARLKSLAEAYGSETAFTKALARNPEWIVDLFDEVNFPVPDSMTADDEVLTDLGKRVDVVVYDGDNADCVIECQDQTGVLDPHHASKVTYYMSANSVDRGILLCDTAPNETKTYVREQNMFMPRDIAIVSVRFLNKEPVFTAIEVPFDRKSRKTTTQNNARDEFLKSIEPLMTAADNHPAVESVATRDDRFIIKIDKNHKKKWDWIHNIEIAPKMTKINVYCPVTADPINRFPEYEWSAVSNKHAADKVLQTEVPRNVDIVALIDQFAALQEG